MKLEISNQDLVLMMSALNDAIKYNAKFLQSEAVKDVSGYGKHLLSLENFQSWLEGEYRRLLEAVPELLNHEMIARQHNYLNSDHT